MRCTCVFVFLLNSLLCYGVAVQPVNKHDMSLLDEEVGTKLSKSESKPIKQNIVKSYGKDNDEFLVQQDIRPTYIQKITRKPMHKDSQNKLSNEVVKQSQLEESKKLANITTPVLKLKNIFSKLDANNRPVLTYYGLMLAGAVARSAASTAVHPLNVVKTMLQTKGGRMPAFTWEALSRGAGSQFIMSVPHGAINFAVTETTKKELTLLSRKLQVSRVIPQSLLTPLEDFCSSALSTFICSIVSTPQMVLTDRIMAGLYTNFFRAVLAVYANEGILGFYTGWGPALVQKIPSYALTWMFFQQIKTTFKSLMNRAGTTLENTLLGSLAAAFACCVMIPVDTVKTRIVTQPPGVRYYTGMLDCLSQILRKEGVWALYRSLPPRLCSVVPMIGIQFAVYELMKRLLMNQPPPKQQRQREREREHTSETTTEVKQ